jgi:hypothetical protein
MCNLLLLFFLIIILLNFCRKTTENFEGWYVNRSPVCYPIYQEYLFNPDNQNKEIARKLAIQSGCVDAEYW